MLVCLQRLFRASQGVICALLLYYNRKIKWETNMYGPQRHCWSKVVCLKNICKALNGCVKIPFFQSRVPVSSVLLANAWVTSVQKATEMKPHTSPLLHKTACQSKSPIFPSSVRENLGLFCVSICLLFYWVMFSLEPPESHFSFLYKPPQFLVLCLVLGLSP